MVDVFALARAILRKWLLLLLLAACATATGYLFTFLLPEKFEGTAMILLRPEEKITISERAERKELLEFPVSQAQSSAETATNTYLEIIQSRVMAEKVVRALGLDRPEEREPNIIDRWLPWIRPWLDELKPFIRDVKDYLFYGRAFGSRSDFEAAVNAFLKNISLSAIADTHLFEVTYYGKDPEEASDVTNATARLFLDYVAETNTSEQRGSLKFIGDQLAEGEKQLAAALETLRRFKAKQNTVAFQEEAKEAIQLIGDLESDLEKVKTELSGRLASKGFTASAVASLRAEQDYLESSLQERQARLAELPTKEALLASLQLEVEAAKDTYKFLRQQYDELRIRQAKQLREMRIVTLAAAPHTPAKPIRIMYALGAGFVALVIGIYLVGMAELTNTTIRSVADVEQALDLPVLATVPKTRLLLTKRA